MADVERDEISGTDTTGHEWDGIKELNTPLPRWWILTFYATIVWALGYVILYPEGMIKLNPAAGEILRRCDGAHTVAALIDDLKRQFPDAENLSNDVLTFLGTAHEHQWIRDKSA